MGNKKGNNGNKNNFDKLTRKNTKRHRRTGVGNKQNRITDYFPSNKPDAANVEINYQKVDIKKLAFRQLNQHKRIDSTEAFTYECESHELFIQGDSRKVRLLKPVLPDIVRQ